MLKVAHIDTGTEPRGGQHQLLLLAQGLRQRGHEQLIVCPEGSALETRAQHEGFRVFSLPPRDPAHAHGIFQLRERLQTERFDILHAHDGRGHTLAWLASFGMRVCRIATRRVTFLPSRLATRLLRRDFACQGIIAVSGSIQRQLVDAGIRLEKIEVIPDGVELPSQPRSSEMRERARARWGVRDNEFVVGHLGAFTREKGQDIALEAINLLRAKLPQARLILAGDGPMRTAREILAKAAQAGDRARLLGYVDDLAEFFAGLDLFIMPSRAEGLGSSVLLAMAHGLAVVASKVGGLPEIVDEGKTGWLVPPASPSALAEAIVAAASDPKRLDPMGSNGRERAQRFSSDIMVQRTECFYRRFTDQKTGVSNQESVVRSHMNSASFISAFCLLAPEF